METIYRFVIPSLTQTFRIDVFRGVPGTTIVECDADAITWAGNWERGLEEYGLGLQRPEKLSLTVDLSRIPTDLKQIIGKPIRTAGVPVLEAGKPVYYPPTPTTVWVVSSTINNALNGAGTFVPLSVFVQKAGIDQGHKPLLRSLEVELTDIRVDVLEQMNWDQLQDWIEYLYSANKLAPSAVFDFLWDSATAKSSQAYCVPSSPVTTFDCYPAGKFF